MSKHPPEYMGTGFATHHNRRLKWDQKLNLIGEKVFDPMIHCCGKCRLPILNYGRMIPKACKHVFCFDCAKSTDKVYLRCGESVQRIEQSPLGKIFVCTYGSSKHSVEGCRRTYLSQRDLQAHISHRHLRVHPSQAQQQQQPQQQSQQQQREQPQQLKQQQQQPQQQQPQQQQPSITTAPVQDQTMRNQSRMPDTPVSDHRTPGYETFSQPHQPPNQMHNPYEEGPDAMPDSPTAQEEYEMGRIQVRKSNLITVPLQDNSAPQHLPPQQHAPQHALPPGHHPSQQHPAQHPPSVSVYQSNMLGQLPQQHPSVPPPPPPQHGYPQHGPVSYAPPMATHSVPQSVPHQQQPPNPHYSMAPLPPVPPVSHMGQPPSRYDSGPPHPPFSGQGGPMASQSPPFQSAVLPTSTGPQWNAALGPPPPRIIMTQAPSMPAPVPAPGMSHPQSAPPPRPDMGPPPRTDSRYRTPYFS